MEVLLSPTLIRNFGRIARLNPTKQQEAFFMARKVSLIVAATVAFGVVTAPGSFAGSDMIIDNSAQAPPPQTYSYAPPPPVYYAPPPVSVVVAPAYRYYYAHPVRVYGYHRWIGRGFHRPFHHWH
jgi:hypothetical protein